MGSDDSAQAPGIARAERGGRPLGRESSRAEFEAALERLGHIRLTQGDRERAWDAFQELAASKGTVTTGDLEAVVDDRLRALAEQYQLLRMETRTRTGDPAWARVEILERNVQGPPLEAEGEGDGPIDAALNAVVEALNVDARLVAFSVEALSSGQDALAEAHVIVEVGGRHRTAEGVAPSLTEAGVRAFLRALSAAKREERGSA